MNYSKPSNKSFTATIKHLLLMAFAILTIGCGEKKSDGVNAHESESVDIESDGVNIDELEDREGVAYLKNSDSPYTGKIFDFHDNGQKKAEGNLKDGKLDGLLVWWHENGQKKAEENYKDGEYDGLSLAWYENGQKKAEGNFKDNELISGKFWNSKGEEVDSLEEADQ
jgi:antitoxin component YwqK of YwqJK toxin-antitoxin module